MSWQTAECVRRLRKRDKTIADLQAEVRRLTQDNEALLAGCEYGVNYLTEAFGADSSITIALRQVVESKQAGAT